MWFESIDKQQFTRFALQESRLDNAYWCGVLIDHIDDTLKPSPKINRLKIRLQKNILRLVDAVGEDVDNLRGLQREILYHHLKYVSIFCNIHTNVNNILSFNESIALPISDDKKASLEMEFIQQRAELIPGEDLMTQWDRGIYILYGSLKVAQSGDDAPGNPALSRRLLAATDLMSPSFIQLYRYCNSYSNHLEVPWLAKMKICSQYVGDCKRLFSAGRELVQFSSYCMAISNEISQRINDEDQQDFRMIEQRQNIIQENLITTNLNKSNNLIRGIISAGR